MIFYPWIPFFFVIMSCLANYKKALRVWIYYECMCVALCVQIEFMYFIFFKYAHFPLNLIIINAKSP